MWITSKRPQSAAKPCSEDQGHFPGGGRLYNAQPSCPNREFFCGDRELNRAIRESFALIRESRSRPLFGPLPCRQSDRPDRSRTYPGRRTETPPDARKSPKPISSSALSSPRRAANRSPSASTRTVGRSGLHDGGVGRVARTRVHRTHVEGDRGFESTFLQRRDGMGQAARLPTRESRDKVAGR